MTKYDAQKQVLQNQQEFNQAIAASIRDAVVGIDNNHHVISWNKGAEHMYKVKAKDILGKHVHEAYTTKLLDISLSQWAKVMKEKGYWKGDGIQTLKNGKQILVRCSTSTVYNTEGNDIGAVAVNRDITDIRQKELALRESEQRFKKLFEKSTDVISIIDDNGNRLFATPSIKTVLGYDANEHIGVSGFTKIHPDDIPQVCKVLTMVKKRYGMSVPYLYRVQHKNGSWIWIEGTATNLLHEPSIKGIVLNYRNVNERIKDEQQKDDFVAMISHELKSPLTSAKIFMSVLQKLLHTQTNQQAEKLAEKVNKQIAILIGLVEDILEFNHIQHGNFAKLEKQTFYLRDLAEEVIEDIKLTTVKELVVDWHTHYLVYADREKLREVFINLLTNALKYSPDGEKVIFSSRKVNNTIVVSIQDFGIGIPQDKLDKVFDRFYQVEEHATYPGIGLGLYICNEIIKLHKGKMWVKSKEGQGSTFYFSVPIYQEASH